MWGTDWPISLKQLTYDNAVALYRDHLDFLPADDHEQVLSRTVQQVWPFGL
jgi:predicted TIM-barrel fold metal-dependent hydrolase